MNFDINPFIVIWELTRACDLACKHCRAEAQALPSPHQLSPAEGIQLLDQIRGMGNPLLVFTGGDPLKRPDLEPLIRHAVGLGLRLSITPSGTSLLDQPAVQRFKELGIARMALSLDAPTQAEHDAFRGVEGSFQWTVDACRYAAEAGLSLQINTSISRHNLHQIPQMAALVESLGAVMWSVFFVVPTGRAQADQNLSPEEFETAFAQIHAAAQKKVFDVKTTEAPHYRRYLLQHHAGPNAAAAGPLPRMHGGLGDGRGFVFVSHTGDVFPSGFLPLAGGNIREKPLAEIYRESPLFKAMRKPDEFKGKCGRCEFRQVCGGSRARAYADSGDALGSDPACVYQPGSKAQPVFAMGAPA